MAGFHPSAVPGTTFQIRLGGDDSPLTEGVILSEPEYHSERVDAGWYAKARVHGVEGEINLAWVGLAPSPD